MKTIYLYKFSPIYLNIALAILLLGLIIGLMVSYHQKHSWGQIQDIFAIVILLIVLSSTKSFVLTFLVVLIGIIYSISKEKKKKDVKNATKIIGLTLIAVITSCVLLSQGIQLIYWKNSIKKESCEIVVGKATLLKSEEIYNREDFKGYSIDFSIKEHTFNDIGQNFPLEVLNAMEDGIDLKVYFYQNHQEIIILKIEALE